MSGKLVVAWAGARACLQRATFALMQVARFYFWHFELPLMTGAGVANA
jgi:hypothetical protein